MNTAERHQMAYFGAVGIMAERCQPGSYDACYWQIELETRGSLSSTELHRRATQMSRKSQQPK